MASAFQQLPNSLRRIPRATNSFVCPYATARRRISPSSSQNPFSISTRALHRSNCEPQRYFPYREQPIAPLRSVRQTVARHGTKCFNPVAHQHRGYKTVQEMRSRYKFGVRLISYFSLAIQDSISHRPSNTDFAPRYLAILRCLCWCLSRYRSRHGRLLSVRERAHGET